MLLFIENRKKYIYLTSSFLIFGALQFISYLTTPLYLDFIRFNQNLEKGWGNPSLFSATRAVIEGLFSLFKKLPPAKAYIGLFGVIALAIGYLSWKSLLSLRADKELNELEKTKILILFFCVIYALLVPRFIAYSHLILIVPAYFAMRRFLSTREAFWLFFILVSLQIPERAGPPWIDVAFQFIWTYPSVLVALALWWLYRQEITKLKSKS